MKREVIQLLPVASVFDERALHIFGQGLCTLLCTLSSTAELEKNITV